MATFLEPSKVTLLQIMNLLNESLSTTDVTRKAALQKLEEMLGSSTFKECLVDSFQSNDPALREFMESLKQVMVTAKGHPEVRQKIVCLLETIVNAVGPRYDCLDPLLNALLKGVQDENELVQSMACSALGTFLDEFSEWSVPHVRSTIEALATALISKYQPTNLPEFFKVITNIAISFGNHLNDEPEYIPLLLTSLISQWEALQSDENYNEVLPSLLECVLAILKATKSGCLPFFEPLFNGCISLLNQNSVEQDKDDNVTFAALGLLTRLIGEMASANLKGLIKDSNIMPLLIQNMQDSSPKVRLASFDLFFELTESCFDDIVRPFLPDCMPILSENLMPEFHSDDDELPSVSDKAFSVLVKIAVKLGVQMKDYISLVLPQLLVLVNLQNEKKSDAAIILGRLGLFCYNQIAPFYNQFAQQWCASFEHVKDEDMKESSFRGMLRLITTNLGRISNDDFIFSFCKQVYSWLETYRHGEMLKQMLIQVLWDFRSGVGEGEWRRLIGDDQVVWEE